MKKNLSRVLSMVLAAAMFLGSFTVPVSAEEIDVPAIVEAQDDAVEIAEEAVLSEDETKLPEEGLPEVEEAEIEETEIEGAAVEETEVEETEVEEEEQLELASSGVKYEVEYNAEHGAVEIWTTSETPEKQEPVSSVVREADGYTIDEYSLNKEDEFSVSYKLTTDGEDRLAELADVSKTVQGSSTSIMDDFAYDDDNLTWTYKFTSDEATKFVFKTDSCGLIKIPWDWDMFFTVTAKRPDGRTVEIPDSFGDESDYCGYLINTDYSDIKVVLIPDDAYFVYNVSVNEEEGIGEYQYPLYSNANYVINYPNIENKIYVIDFNCSDLRYQNIVKQGENPIDGYYIDADKTYNVYEKDGDGSFLAKIKEATIALGTKSVKLDLAEDGSAIITPEKLKAINASGGKTVTVSYKSGLSIAEKESAVHHFNLVISAKATSVKSISNMATGKKLKATSPRVFSLAQEKGSTVKYQISYDVPETNDLIEVSAKEDAVNDGFDVAFNQNYPNEFSVTLSKQMNVSGKIQIVNKSAETPVVLAEIDVSAVTPQWTSKAPNAKIIGSTDTFVALELAPAKGVATNGDFAYEVKLTSNKKTNLPDGIILDNSVNYYSVEKSQVKIYPYIDTRLDPNSAVKEPGEGFAANFDIEVKLVQMVDENNVFLSSSPKALKNQGTKAPFIYDQIKLKKAASTVYVGQRNVKIATVDFGKKATNITTSDWKITKITDQTGKSINVNNSDWLLSVGANPDNDFDNGIYVSTINTDHDHSGIYTVSVESKDSLCSASISFKVENAIARIYGDWYCGMIYKAPGKAGSGKAEFFAYDSAYERMTNPKLKYAVGTVIIKDHEYAGVTPVPGLTITNKGIIKIAKNAAVDTTVNTTYTVWAIPADETLYDPDNGYLNCFWNFRITDDAFNAKSVDTYKIIGKDEDGKPIYEETPLTKNSVIPIDLIEEVGFVFKDKNHNEIYGSKEYKKSFDYMSNDDPVIVTDRTVKSGKVTYTFTTPEGKKVTFSCKVGYNSKSEEFTRLLVNESPVEDTGNKMEYKVINDVPGGWVDVNIARYDEQYFGNWEYAIPEDNVNASLKVVSGAQIDKKESSSVNLRLRLTKPFAIIKFMAGDGTEKELRIVDASYGDAKLPKVKEIKANDEDILINHFYSNMNPLLIKLSAPFEVPSGAFENKIYVKMVGDGYGDPDMSPQYVVSENGDAIVKVWPRESGFYDGKAPIATLYFYVRLQNPNTGEYYKYYLTNKPLVVNGKFQTYAKSFAFDTTKVTFKPEGETAVEDFELALSKKNAHVTKYKITEIIPAVVNGKYTDIDQIFEVKEVDNPDKPGEKIQKLSLKDGATAKLREEAEKSRKKVPNSRTGYVRVTVYYDDYQYAYGSGLYKVTINF